MRKDVEAPAGAEEPAAADPLADRVRAAASRLEPLVARAEQARQDRAAARPDRAATEQRGAPRWTDVFTTQFTEFSNRPR
jgi:hypothetical protein